MSLQSIINIAESISFNRRRVVGLQYTRNEIIRVSETPTRQPWRMTVKVSAGLDYADVRDLIEGLDAIDRSEPEVITFSANPGLDFMCANRGSLTTANASAVTIGSFTGTTLVLNNLPLVGAPSAVGSLLFRAGDFIQVEDKPYPFTVVSDVTRTSSTSCTVTVHRPNFFDESVVGDGIVLGNDVSFNMLCTNMPTYTLSAGGRTALVTFDGDFQLYEYTGTIL